MGENEQGGSLRTVIVLALIAIIGLVITTAAVSMAAKVKGEHQNTSSLVNKHLSETNDSINATDTEENTIFIWSCGENSYGERVATVHGFISGKETTKVIIPKYRVVNGKKYTVTHIDSGAFSRKNLTSVSIPDSVTYIGNQAFYGNALTNIDIPSSVTTLGYGVFASNKLTSVTIPNSITVIPSKTFQGNRLTNVRLPDTLTGIGSQAFYANRLTTVTIPDQVTWIGDHTFESNKLTTIKMSKNIQKIGDSAFWYNDLTTVELPSTVNNFGYREFGNTRIVMYK